MPELQGNPAGPSPSKYYVFVKFECDSRNDTQWHCRYRIGLYVYSDTPGYTADFYGTLVDTSWAGRVALHGGGVYAQTGWTDGGWHNYGDHAHVVANASYTGGSGYHNSAIDAWWRADTPTWTPYKITDASASRVSDSENALTWKNHAVTARPYARIWVDRSIDGGSWSNIAELSGGASSYRDRSTQANHSYRYRVIPNNSTASASDHTYTGTVYNTPCAPVVSKVARQGETSVAITIENKANTATGIELQRSTDRTTWATVKTLSGKVTSATDSPGGGTFYYRARNTRGSLKSAWSPCSGAVVTICPPNAPTLAAPPSGETVSKAQDSVTFSWAHATVDGSAQTAAEVACSVNGGASWTTVAVSGSSALLELPNSHPVNSTVTWRVRTKGVHADWGPWSDTRVFFVKQQPTVTIENSAYGDVIENTPIGIELSYSDVSGSLASARLEIVRGGSIEYERDLGTALAASVSSSEFPPKNGESYTIRVHVRSTSTLVASTERDIGIMFVPPQSASLFVEPDVDTGHVSITVRLQKDDSKAPAESVAVHRVADGRRVLIGDGLADGSVLVDRYAPVNVDYSYEAVSSANSGAIATESFDGIMRSPYFYFYFGDRIAKAMWNPGGSKKLSRPSRELKYLWGVDYPVSYDTDHMSETHGFSALVIDRADYMAFRRLVESGGSCVYKSGDGDVFRAEADVDVSPDYRSQAYYGTVSASITRTAGDPL